jgi:hypothetical protein
MAFGRVALVAKQARAIRAYNLCGLYQIGLSIRSCQALGINAQEGVDISGPCRLPPFLRIAKTAKVNICDTNLFKGFRQG